MAQEPHRVTMRGRPTKPEGRLVPVSTQIPAETYDALYRMAQQCEMKIAELVREVLVQRTGGA